MYLLSRWLTVRISEELASEIAEIPDRSEFIRAAIENALERQSRLARIEAAKTTKG
jgi:metal-responsive CopG/Arc/MetJ family transcriptional regulator